MIDGLKPYSAYKDSGVSWLSQIPNEWTVRRLGQAVRLLVSNVDKHTFEDELPVRLCNYVDVYKNDRIRANMPFMRATATPVESIRFRLKVGDVVITKDSESWQDIAVPALVVSEADDLVCGYHLAILRSNGAGLQGGYLHWALQSEPVSWQFRVSANGVTRYGLSHGAIKDAKIPSPSSSEQSAIVRFLDHADRRIRRYIKAKRRLVTLLNEQKQAIIHRAVTCGLDPNVRLKASGIEWFPRIPTNWSLVTMRRVVRCAIDGPHHSPEYHDAGIPFLSARNIKADRWSLDDVKYISNSDFREFSRRIVPLPGDVLYTKGGTTGVARAVDLTFPFQVWVHVAVLKLVRDKIDPQFLAVVLNSPRCYEQSQLFTRGATNQDLGLNRMKDIVLPLPPLNQQVDIVASLNKQLAVLQESLGRIEREIALLREYRTRLIADVVTGKLDVRNASAQISDDACNRDMVDDSEVLAVDDQTIDDADLETVASGGEAD